LGELGIAGETIGVSPARSVKDVVKMGLLKGYKTMVVIGSDWLANQVAGCICGRNITLGLIPVKPNQEISELIQTKDIKKACEALKYRKVEIMNMGFIEPNRFFFTSASINSDKPFSLEINWDRCRIQTRRLQDTGT